MFQSQWLLGNERTHKVEGHGRDTMCGVHAQISKELQTPIFKFYIDKVRYYVC